eukprot:3626938-Prymnesium_polylepis.1
MDGDAKASERARRRARRRGRVEPSCTGEATVPNRSRGAAFYLFYYSLEVSICEVTRGHQGSHARGPAVSVARPRRVPRP